MELLICDMITANLHAYCGSITTVSPNTTKEPNGKSQESTIYQIIHIGLSAPRLFERLRVKPHVESHLPSIETSQYRHVSPLRTNIHEIYLLTNKASDEFSNSAKRAPACLFKWARVRHERRSSRFKETIFCEILFRN